MTKGFEGATTDSELSQATAEFVSALRELAPEIQDGQTAIFEESSKITRRTYESHFSCNIIPAADVRTPPTITLFRGPSAIWHKEQIFTFNKDTESYWKKQVNVGPGLYETMAPEEHHKDPVPATATELGRILGILEFLELRPTPSEDTPEATANPRTLGKRLFSILQR